MINSSLAYLTTFYQVHSLLASNDWIITNDDLVRTRKKAVVGSLKGRNWGKLQVYQDFLSIAGLRFEHETDLLETKYPTVTFGGYNVYYILMNLLCFISQ